MADVGEFERLDEPVEKVDVIDNAVDNEEELDDLFGDEDDDADAEDEENAPVEQSKKRHMNIDANSEEEDDEEEVPYDNFNEPEEAPKAEITIKNMTLARHPISHTPSSGLSFPLPRFLSVNPDPFQPMEFENQIKSLAKDSNNESLKGSLQFKKLELTNTIRWRYAKAANGSLHKQSNTQIIEWEDGSKSLKIGKEYFDIKLKQNDDDILTLVNENADNSLMGMIPLDKSVQIVPPSTTSKAHKLLAMTIKSGMKHKKAKKINTIVTDEDPEAKARDVEKAQREIEKARRRQQQKAEMEEAEMERRREPTSSYSRGVEADEAEDDEEDDDDYGEGGGFVVGDEEDVESGMDDDELDIAAEKLKQVKRDGASKYREREDEEDEDEGGVVRKKRRVILDDEEEDSE